MRINQFVAHASGLSRRQADQAIAAGRVSRNGQPAKIGDTVGTGEVIELGGEVLHLPDYVLVALHKPVGYVSSRRQQGKAPTIYALLPPELQALKPVGRLDQDSSGLLLLTNDGELSQQLQHPGYSKRKRYRVRLDRELRDSDMTKLQRGIQLQDGISRLEIQRHPGWLEVSLEEGRNRQIRRSFGAVGYRVVELHRTAVGPIELGQLAVGQWRQLDANAATSPTTGTGVEQ